MSNMIKWKKPSGVEIETNDDPLNIQAAEDLKWKREGSAKPKGKPEVKAKGKPDEDSE